jgi:hypothetical protein
MRVLEFGASKYAPENWRKVDKAKQRYMDAALRHQLMGWLTGESRDEESGRHVLAHAVCSLMFVMELDLQDNPTVEDTTP